MKSVSMGDETSETALIIFFLCTVLKILNSTFYMDSQHVAAKLTMNTLSSLIPCRKGKQLLKRTEHRKYGKSSVGCLISHRNNFNGKKSMGVPNYYQKIEFQ